MTCAGICCPTCETIRARQRRSSGLVIIVLSLAMLALTLSFPAFIGQRYGTGSVSAHSRQRRLIVCGCDADLERHRARGRQARTGSKSRPGCATRARADELLPRARCCCCSTSSLAETVGFIPIAFAFLLTLVHLARRAPADRRLSSRVDRDAVDPLVLLHAAARAAAARLAEHDSVRPRWTPSIAASALVFDPLRSAGSSSPPPRSGCSSARCRG